MVETIQTFADLNRFCDKIILETYKWRDIYKIQIEDYFKIADNNAETCNRLCEVKQKINILTFLQNQIQMDLCESESNYNAIEKHVKELEAITPENFENQTLHNSIYTTAVCLNTSLNALQDTLDALNVNVGNDAKVKANEPCGILLSKQLALLESLERKMYFICNETQRLEELQNRIAQDMKRNIYLIE